MVSFLTWVLLEGNGRSGGMTRADAAGEGCLMTAAYESFRLGVGNCREDGMSAYELLVLAIAGANGGMFYYALRRREQVLAWIKVKARRR